jgi:hypothetical protein
MAASLRGRQSRSSRTSADEDIAEGKDKRDIRPTSEKICPKVTQIWTTQKENNAERGESLMLKETYFNVNIDTQQRGNILT